MHWDLWLRVAFFFPSLLLFSTVDECATVGFCSRSTFYRCWVMGQLYYVLSLLGWWLFTSMCTEMTSDSLFSSYWCRHSIRPFIMQLKVLEWIKTYWATALTHTIEMLLWKSLSEYWLRGYARARCGFNSHCNLCEMVKRFSDSSIRFTSLLVHSLICAYAHSSTRSWRVHITFVKFIDIVLQQRKWYASLIIIYSL